MKKKLLAGIVLFFVFFAGVGIGNADETVVTKEVPVEKVVEKNVENPAWKELKELDDQVFVVAGETMGLCGQGYKAILSGDENKLGQINEQTNENTAKINSFASKRATILKKLGY